MAKRLTFEAKELIVDLAGSCFWYWDKFYSFLRSCGVTDTHLGRYPREAFSNKHVVMRNLLSDFERDGKEEIITNIVSGFYKLKGAVDPDNLDNKKAKELLMKLREAVGSDPIDAEISRRQREQAKDTYTQSVQANVHKRIQLEKLNSRFLELATGTSHTPQQRGFELERVFFELLRIEEFEHTAPYKTQSGEQIDGHFKHEKFDYLVEVKWTDGSTKQPDLSVFDGKIKGKAQSTRGLFLSANGFDVNAIQKFSGDSPRIILVTGEDLVIVLGGRLSFADAMKAKVDAIVRHGLIHHPVRASV